MREGFFYKYVHTPRRVWLRRLAFQIHLWTGLILGLYIILISLTGSILVFHQELERLSDPRPVHPLPEFNAGRVRTSITQVIGNVRSAYPNSPISTLITPIPAKPLFLIYLKGGGHGPSTAFADPLTGELIKGSDSGEAWMAWIDDLHTNLLSGRAGRTTNGIGAVILLLMCVTGSMIWWPGLRIWTRGLKVNFRKRWKRINFDLHSAAGFWTLGMISFWAISGVYFAWRTPFIALIKHFSPATSSGRPVFTVSPPFDGPEPDLDEILGRAQELSGPVLAEVEFPDGDADPLTVDVDRGERGDDDDRDYIYFDPHTGAYLATWHYGEKHSAGDWIIWLIPPIHFGTYWGLGVKVIWAFVGLIIPLLAVTGALMYWNRVLRKC